MRGVVSTICSVFDPLNPAAPVMLSAKQIMQELWRLKRAWDQTLEGEFLQKWLQWKNDLPLLAKVNVPSVGLTMKELLYRFITSAKRPKLDMVPPHTSELPTLIEL